MPEAPSCSSSSISGRLSNTMFLFVHAISVYSWSVRCFSFQYCVVCFVLLNKRVDPAKFVLERDTLRYHCLEHSSFRFHYPAKCSLFLVLRLVFHFMFLVMFRDE